MTDYLAITKGTIALGGNSDASDLRIQPTVIVDPDPDEPLMKNEVFGPILPVISVESLYDAIQFINSRPKPLSVYVFTKTGAVRERVIKEVPAGGMLVNHLAFQYFTSKLPFDGVESARRGWGLPWTVGVRGVQPPQGSVDQADETRHIELSLPAV